MLVIDNKKLISSTGAWDTSALDVRTLYYEFGR